MASIQAWAPSLPPAEESTRPALPYAVYTRAYDCVLRADALVPATALRSYSHSVASSCRDQRIDVRRIGRALHSCMGIFDTGMVAHASGRLDRRRLSRIVSAPLSPDLFLADCHREATGGIATVLIDCSGSMKRHALDVACLADALVRAFDSAESDCEVLAYTTRSWNGGRAAQDWVRAGSPPSPGRLAEILHLVVKEPGEGSHTTRRSVAALLHAPMYREGIDGEAVAWAARRMLGRPAFRRLLMVISDGSPMDRATAMANGDDEYIIGHLRTVVRSCERAGVRVLGVELGTPTDSAYSQWVRCDPHTMRVPEMLERIVARILAMGRTEHGH